MEVVLYTRVREMLNLISYSTVNGPPLSAASAVGTRLPTRSAGKQQAGSTRRECDQYLTLPGAVRVAQGVPNNGCEEWAFSAGRARSFTEKPVAKFGRDTMREGSGLAACWGRQR